MYGSMHTQLNTSGIHKHKHVDQRMVYTYTHIHEYTHEHIRTQTPTHTSTHTCHKTTKTVGTTKLLCGSETLNPKPYLSIYPK